MRCTSQRRLNPSRILTLPLFILRTHLRRTDLTPIVRPLSLLLLLNYLLLSLLLSLLFCRRTLLLTLLLCGRTLLFTLLLLLLS